MNDINVNGQALSNSVTTTADQPDAKAPKEYTLILVFDSEQRNILVQRKEHGPKNLIGSISALGGKVEPNETLEECAVREFNEESGLSIIANQMKKFHAFAGNNGKELWECHAYKVILSAPPTELPAIPQSIVDERPYWLPVINVLYLDNKDINSQLRWLTAMAIDKSYANGQSVLG